MGQLANSEGVYKMEYNGWPNYQTWLAVTASDALANRDQDERTQETIKAILDSQNTGYPVIENDIALGGLPRAVTLALADTFKEAHAEEMDEAIDQLKTANSSYYIESILRAQHIDIDFLYIAEHYDDDIRTAIANCANVMCDTWREKSNNS